MSEIVSPLLRWLNENPQLAGLFTFLISAGESVAILGTIVPGSIMMTAIGALAGAGVIPLWPTIIWAILGAIVGDGISYWIGHYFKDRLPNVWPFRKYPNLLITGEAFFKKHGSMSVFIGRFVGPVRALVPLVAGMLGMKPLKFYIANIASAIGWAPAYMMPGILLGAASLELPPDIAIHFILAILLIGLFILLCLWFVYKLFQLISGRMTQLQNEIWRRLRASKYFTPVTTVLQHYDPKRTHGQLTLAIYLTIIFIFFLCLTLYVKLNGAANIGINDAVFHLFRGVRTPQLDNIMIHITMFGQKQVVAVMLAILAVFLYAIRKKWTALHLLIIGFVTGGSIFVLKRIIQSPRPWGILQSPETYSMPSGHATIALVIYGGLSILIASSLPSRWRWLIYLIGALIIFIVSMSRLYLGVHWFTDILGGWLLGTALLMFIVISYLRRYEPRPKPLQILGVSLLSLLIAVSVMEHYCFVKMKTNFTQVNWPIVFIEQNDWWQSGASLPTYRVSLFGFPSQKINIQWAGDLQTIEATLVKAGWLTPPDRNWISTLHRIADVRSTQYLPMISPQYLDKKPALILVKHLQDKKVLVLRLWNSNRILNDTPVWVGTVGIIPRSYSWIYSMNSGRIEIDQTLIFPHLNQHWETKNIIVNTTPTRRRPVNEQMLLIQPKT